MKFLKLSISCLAFVCLSLIGMAQQDAMFTQYFFNPLALNPAYAGSRESMHVGVISREQWIGVKGRPRTQSVFIHSPLRKKSLALGFTALRDQAGPLVNTQIAADIAYRFTVSENSKVSIAMRASTNLLNGYLTQLEHTGTDITFQQDIGYAIAPNVGAGVYWWSNHHYLGLGVPKILNNGISAGNDQILAYMEDTHAFATAGFVIGANKKGLKLKPSAIIKYVKGAPLQVDVGASILLLEKLWLGAVYRIDTDIAGVLAYQFSDQLRIGYSYDYNLGRISQFSDGSHEVTLSYDFIFKKDNYMSPRFF